MIRIKIVDGDNSRTKHLFNTFYRSKNIFLDVGIEFVNNNSYDFLFVGMDNFINKRKSLIDSINEGSLFINSLSGDKFIFDGSDSTSLMGAIEVLRNSDAKYLFKNQLLKREEYSIPTTFNKWFFGGGEFNLSYDISEEEYKKIKLSGYNLGYHNDYSQMAPIQNKTIDLCAIFNSEHPINSDHLFRNDSYYNLHRQTCKSEVDKLKNKYSIITGKYPFQTYVQYVKNSKFSLSPFGMGEICFRDFEIMTIGSCLIKPDMSRVITAPNIYSNNTYISVNLDFSNLEKKIDENVNNFTEKLEVLREEYIKNYALESFVKHWYNVFKEISTIETE